YEPVLHGALGADRAREGLEVLGVEREEAFEDQRAQRLEPPLLLEEHVLGDGLDEEREAEQLLEAREERELDRVRESIARPRARALVGPPRLLLGDGGRALLPRFGRGRERREREGEGDRPLHR